MSDTKGFEVSVKEYAVQRGKTVQAVYQQMKRKENAEALEGHILLRQVGNKKVKYLDDVAVGILDMSSNSAPLTIVGAELKEELAVANDRIRQLEAMALMNQGKVELLLQQLAEKEKELRALAEPQSIIDALTAQNDDLRAERDEAMADAQAAKDEAQNERERVITWKEYRARKKAAKRKE